MNGRASCINSPGGGFTSGRELLALQGFMVDVQDRLALQRAVEAHQRRGHR